MTRLHVVDGTFELFRAHYTKRPGHEDPSGRDVKATVGFMRNMLRLFQDEAEAVTHVGVAFDNPIESFRNDLFDGYKTGEGMEPALWAQFDLAERAAAAIGMVVWRMDRWEADDALATAATRFSDQVDQVRILTPDKDLGQVVRGTKIVQVDVIRNKLIDEAAVTQARVPPASIPDFLALVGDTADGIPGLPRFGAKTVSTLLRRYGKLEAIPAEAADWDVKVRGAEGLAKTLRERRDDAMLYRTLATLVTDVPLPQSLEDLRYRGVDAAAFEALCSELDAPRLRERATRFR